MSAIITGLNRLLVRQGDAVGRWFETEFARTPPPITSSVDLRHSGARLVPVDTNLFPAGWNKISEAARRRARTAFKIAVRRMAPGAERVLLVPENHTRNQGYLANLVALRAVLTDAGFEVRLGRAVDGASEPATAEVEGGPSLVLEPLVKRDGRLVTRDGFDADAVVVNNDLSDGLPELLAGIIQPIAPPPALGWHSRTKSGHFGHYEAVAREFAEAFDLDPWTLAAAWRNCGTVDFRQREGLDCVARGVDEIVGLTRSKHRQYHLAYEPYVFVKADSGTYGMGVMTVSRGEELYAMNKKRRHSMDVIKGGVQNTRVVVQEGVPTVDLMGGAAAEPVVYLVDGKPTGGFYRVHKDKGEFESLNATGSGFAEMCEEVEEPELEPHEGFDGGPCNFRVFGAVARLATLAAAREAVTPDHVPLREPAGVGAGE